MKKVENKTITEEKVTIFCDRCSKKIDTIYGSKKCHMCGRDVCSKCGYFYDDTCSLDRPNYSGDHPSIICHECWDIGEQHRKAIMKIRDKVEELEEIEIKLWQHKCKKTSA